MAALWPRRCQSLRAVLLLSAATSLFSDTAVAANASTAAPTTTSSAFLGLTYTGTTSAVSVDPLPCDDPVCAYQAQIIPGSLVKITDSMQPVYDGQEGIVLTANAEAGTYEVQLSAELGVPTMQQANLELQPGNNVSDAETMCGTSSQCRSCPPCGLYTPVALTLPPVTTVTPNPAAAAVVVNEAVATAPRPPGVPASSCMAPQVVNSEGISCDQGLWIETGTSCIADCGDGYYATLETLLCLNGTFAPATFECLDWYNRTRNIVLIAIASLCVLGLIAGLVVTPALMKNKDGATTRRGLTESRPVENSATDDVSNADYKSYSTTLSKSLSKGHDEIRQKVAWFMEMEGKALRNGAQAKSNFEPFEIKTGRADITEIERIIIDITVLKQGDRYSVSHKSRCSMLTGPPQAGTTSAYIDSRAGTGSRYTDGHVEPLSPSGGHYSQVNSRQESHHSDRPAGSSAPLLAVPGNRPFATAGSSASAGSHGEHHTRIFGQDY